MPHTSLNRLVARTLALLALLSGLALPGARPAAAAPVGAPRSAPAAQQATPPDTLVPSGVTSFTVANSKVFWYTSHDQCPPAVATQATGYSEIISRVAVQGSETRQLYNVDTGCSLYTVQSNIVADASYIYWANASGLVRLSTGANVGDQPQVLSAAAAGSQELAIDKDAVYALRVTGSSPNYTSTVRRIAKADGSSATLATRSAYASGVQVSHAFSVISGASDHVYWLESGRLTRYNLTGGAIDSIASSVTAFYAEGGVTTCSNIICTTSDRVYFSSGGQVSYYSNYGDSTTPVYTSAERVYGLTTDGKNLFMLEEHFVPCSPSPCIGGTYTDYVTRRGRGASGATEILYTSATGVFSGPALGLTNANGYLLWEDSGRVLRLPTNVGGLPLTNMRVTGISITQGIQKADNSVLLVAGRRTFVRVFVASDGAPVSGVTARLQRIDALGNTLDSLLPVNSVGTSITVSNAPKRANLNDSYLFELPWGWLSTGLRLRAVLNPYHAPPQSSYANNTMSAGPFTFKASPALKVQFVAWQYYFNNKLYTPRYIKDIIQTYSWIIRAYPLASKIIFDNTNTPGFHPNLWFQGDDKLGALVNRTDPSCNDLITYNPDHTIKDDNRNLCASRYTNIQMNVMRSDAGISQSRFFYGMISDGLKFPRGQACCAPAVSSGPVGSGTWGWDFDGSYADWYAAHEIGHTLGRAHPSKGNACGHSASDPSYPYAGAAIGADDTAEGFDAGDTSLGVPRAVYPGTKWFDVMSYCDNQWISDYTYTGMYNYMVAHPSLNAVRPQATGDFLSISGSITPDAGAANIVSLRHIASVATVPPLEAGPNAIRLLDAASAELAKYSFTPTSDSEGETGTLGFSQVVNFVAGTRTVQIVQQADGKVLASASVSPSAPQVSNVALAGASGTVTGTVTLNWDASDADPGVLTFTILYSGDGGQTFQPVRTGVVGRSAAINTNLLGGGTGVLRVVASDGANEAQADSAPFSVAAKPPTPMIVTPDSNITVQYGQLVNFSGAAFDLQDGGVTGAGLVWKDNGADLGTGEQISADTLAVGQHVITLTATNSKGQSASASVTVTVEDDLSLPGPTLTAGPTSFSWQFAAGATAGASETLSVGNAGETGLTWTVSTDAAWLSVTPGSGTDAGEVTLTASPVGVPDGSSLTGTVTLTAPASDTQAAQTITIPVSLSKGFNFDEPKPVAPPRLYVPVVKR
jgi:hypothetical protein